MVVDLIYNLSVLVALSVLSGFIDSRYDRGTSAGKIFQGILFGFVAITGMLYPFRFTEGIIFDGRSIVISLSALFFGPVSGFISSVIAIVFRNYLGGGGALTGSLVIASSFFIGAYFYDLKQRNKWNTSKLNLYIFGVIVSAAMMTFMITLPSQAISNAYETVTLTVMLTYPFITLIIGKILLDQRENKISLERIKEEVSLFRTTLYSIGDAVITTDKFGNVQQMNYMAEQLTGWNEAECRGRSLREIFRIINEKTRNEVENPVSKVLREGKSVTLANHTILISRDEKEIPIADSGAPIRNEKGEILGTVLVFRDKTEEHRSEEALKESETHFRTLADSGQALIWTCGTDKKCNYFNESWLAFTGKTLDQEIGDGWVKGVHPEDVQHCVETFVGSFDRREKFSMVYRVRHNSGEYRWILDDGTPRYNSKGEFLGYIGHCLDITEHKQEEFRKELYRKILELYHDHDDSRALIGEIVQIIRSHSGCEAVGLRLADGEDFPYYETKGFVDGHVKNENSLCTVDLAGNIVRDSSGSAVLECMCGNILCSRFDTSKPFFTAGGSFWTNSTTNLLASTTEEDRQARTRNRCNGEGYESVALIPVRGEKGNIGLLQLNDFQPGRFTPEMIQFYEDIAQAIGISLIGKRAEEALRERESLLSESQKIAHVGSWRLDLDLNRLTWSDEVYRIFGFEPQSFAASYKIFLEHIFPDDRMKVDNAYTDSLRTGKDYYEIEHRIIRPNTGELRHVVEKCIHVRDNSGKVVRSIGMVQDITDWKRAEAELEKHRNHLEELVEERTVEIETINKELINEIEKKRIAERRLEKSLEKEKELSNLKSRFISTASHEFRTPLSSVLSSTEMIQRYYTKWGEEKMSEHLGRIKNSVLSLTTLLDDLLLVNRADSGKIAFSPSDFNLYETCNAALNESRACANENHNFILNYNADGKKFRLDQKQINLILQNLLSNARKYSPGGGKVELAVNSDKSMLQLSVLDEGMGIPDEDIPRLFEPFHRSGNAMEIEGTGLGLSIVKHAVDLHGGSIEVQSKEGAGTKFTITIPLKNYSN